MGKIDFTPMINKIADKYAASVEVSNKFVEDVNKITLEKENFTTLVFGSDVEKSLMKDLLWMVAESKMRNDLKERLFKGILVIMNQAEHADYIKFLKTDYEAYQNEVTQVAEEKIRNSKNKGI